MTHKWRSVVLLPILILMLSGCFRQASEQLDSLESQPISSTSESAGDIPTVAPTSADGEATPTQETLEEPTEPQATPIIAITVETSTPIVPATNVPASPTTPPTVSDTSPTATTEFITPAPVQPTSAVRTPVPTMTNTPNNLATPTQIGGDIPSDECIYMVQSGDNLFRIATANNVSVEELRAVNPDIVGDVIQPNDRIILPNCGDTVVPTPEPAVTSPPNASGQTIHVVESGETMGSIARLYGVTIDAIAAANNIDDVNRLSIGQELIIPISN